MSTRMLLVTEDRKIPPLQRAYFLKVFYFILKFICRSLVMFYIKQITCNIITKPQIHVYFVILNFMPLALISVFEKQRISIIQSMILKEVIKGGPLVFFFIVFGKYNAWLGWCAELMFGGWLNLIPRQIM